MPVISVPMGQFILDLHNKSTDIVQKASSTHLRSDLAALNLGL